MSRSVLRNSICGYIICFKADNRTWFYGFAVISQTSFGLSNLFMNITEFAEQIVFGKTLEEKLAAPGRLSIDPNRNQRKPVGAIVAPGRPYGLEMRTSGHVGLTRPRDDNLENEAERGKLLHFLANHELLATELMALVLLKFPDAPHAFRQGVLVTLQEEQAHTQMYIDRMRECGVEFGAYPVSGQFWQVVAPMQSPMDFVSRLSLTFEQANLDYSQHFANVFRRIGDDATASILQQIYEDEIGHVQHGLHWFRQWKDPEHSDWEAYEASLEFPMSPQRGRAPKVDFNREGRLRAGLTEPFVDAIEVFRKSRGRAVSVRWFDAGAESDVAGSVDQKTKSLTQTLTADLELVMLALAKPDDLLLVQRSPSNRVKKRLLDAGFELPEFVPIGRAQILAERNLHDAAPWAWTPAAMEVVQGFASGLKHGPPTWHDSDGVFYRKSWSTERLREWLSDGDRLDFLCGPEVVGQVIGSVEQFEAASADFAKRGFGQLILKPDLSASGRGQKRFAVSGNLSDGELVDLTALFESGAQAVVEPELDRLMDFSILWDGDGNLLDWSQQLIGPGRKYLGSVLDKSLFGCDSDVKRFFLADKAQKVKQVSAWLDQRLVQSEIGTQLGPFGIDAMVYRDLAGQLKIKPVVELNPRTTMGHVSLALAKRLASGAVGQFRIFTAKQWREIGPGLEAMPLVCTREGHWKSGVVPLGDSDSATKLIPVVLAGSEVFEALDSC